MSKSEEVLISVLSWLQTALMVALFILLILIFLNKMSVEPEVVERNVTVEKIVEIPCEEENVVCPSCPEKIIERVIEKPCPECKCSCVTHGAWADNGTGWWYDEYRPGVNETWNETR